MHYGSPSFVGRVCSDDDVCGMFNACTHAFYKTAKKNYSCARISLKVRYCSNTAVGTGLGGKGDL